MIPLICPLVVLWERLINFLPPFLLLQVIHAINSCPVVVSVDLGMR